VESLRPTVPAAPGRRQEIERFLGEHGDASEADDRLILDYLVSDAASTGRP
jgi:hypothetical protein